MGYTFYLYCKRDALLSYLLTICKLMYIYQIIFDLIKNFICRNSRATVLLMLK